MNAIFLDVDGVLNNTKHLKKIINLLGREQYMSIMHEIHEIPLDYRSCRLIHELVKKTNSVVVLSSCWRLNPSGIEALEKYAKIKIQDKTPRLSTERGYEIKEYLEKHKEITNYVIIDDDCDMLKNQFRHFVHTEFEKGFRKKHYKKCLKILNNKRLGV